DPHRLHDRQRGRDRHGDRRRRGPHAGARRRRLADLAVERPRHGCLANRRENQPRPRENVPGRSACRIPGVRMNHGTTLSRRSCSTARTIARAMRSGWTIVHSSAFGSTLGSGKPSVGENPGRIEWTRTPRPCSWAATEREKASWACLDAEYGPDGGSATVPATETTLTTSAGFAASSAGRKARRHQTPPR